MLTTDRLNLSSNLLYKFESLYHRLQLRYILHSTTITLSLDSNIANIKVYCDTTDHSRVYQVLINKSNHYHFKSSLITNYNAIIG
jgi:IS1 family transposase